MSIVMFSINETTRLRCQEERSSILNNIKFMLIKKKAVSQDEL